MSLNYRRSTLEDLTGCIRALSAEYGGDPQVTACLPSVWARLLASGTIIAGTVEDRTQPQGSQIVSRGASVFVSDTFLEELQTDLPPYPAAQIAARILEGRSPILSLEAVRRANARDGLSLCILHDCYPALPAGTMPDWSIRDKLAESFLYFHRGYRLKQFLQQGCGPRLRDWLLGAGLRLRRDYADYYAAHPEARPAPERHPFLTGVTRQEIDANPGVRAQTLFIYTPPRFGFTIKEQDLLRHAQTGETDEDLAHSLDLSLSMVKKRWGAIYERVLETAPDILGSKPDEVIARADGRRGAERRRHLLNYLHEHPEELNPIGASRV